MSVFLLTMPTPKAIPCSGVDELRPIALTSVLSKLYESYVVSWLKEDIHGKITEAQYGGRSGSSAILALINLVHKWHVALDTPGSVIRLFLDFRKAYDLIDHNIMLKNCCKIGIRPALERERRRKHEEKRLRRKRQRDTFTAESVTSASSFSCHHCGRPCASRIGLVSHLMVHK